MYRCVVQLRDYNVCVFVYGSGLFVLGAQFTYLEVEEALHDAGMGTCAALDRARK